MIESNRLILREFKPEDAEGLFELNADPEVLKYTGDPPFESVEDALKFVADYYDYRKHGMGRWAVLLKDKNEFIGWCGLKYHESTDEVDLGFRFMSKHWNKGYATEAAEACLQYGFEELNIPFVMGRAMHDNRASIKVLEKIGMNNPIEMIFDEHPGLKYHLYKEDYEARS